MAPGPYPYPQAPMPPPYHPGAYGAPAGNDGKAVASLVLGIMSMACCTGILTAIPAIILGVLARRDIMRSQGALGGEGMAIAGIVTGGIATLGTIAYFIFYVAIIGAAVATTPSSPPPPFYAPTPTYAPYTAPTPTTLPSVPPVTGSIVVHDVHKGTGTLHTALALELGEAKEEGVKVLVISVSPSCSACDEFFGELPDPQMQKVLANVNIARVDVNEWKSDLASLGMDKTGLPWFFRFDDTMKLADSLSADEWNENTASNIAPVLDKFLKGTLKHKPATPAPSGSGGMKVLGKDAGGHEVF